MKTVVWLYLFIFVAFFDLHAQYPMLSPFALSMGAAPSFIGLIMGVYSITHLPGNLLAGISVDRYGSKKFIIASLFIAGIILILQSKVTEPWELLIVRSISGFVLAFLSPACLSLLARIARDQIHQGKLMAGNGIVHTTASVVSPAAGAYLVAELGFTHSFMILGWILIGTSILAIFGVKEKGSIAPAPSLLESEHTETGMPSPTHSIPWLFFAVPFALSCSQGILFFELPLVGKAQESIMTSGLLFSMVSLGALCTLSLLFLQRYSSFLRMIAGSIGLAAVFFGMAVHWFISLSVSLFMIGMANGIIFPSIATLLASQSSAQKYGRVFSILSISYSLGAFFGPVVAGQVRETTSPYYIAFLALMIALCILPFNTLNDMKSADIKS